MTPEQKQIEKLEQLLYKEKQYNENLCRENKLAANLIRQMEANIKELQVQLQMAVALKEKAA